MDDAAALAVTLARAQQLLQRPLSPTVAESSVDALTNQLQSITSGRHRRGKRVLSGSRSAAGLRPPRDIRCVDGELHNHEEAYHNALDTLDEITREMKEKMKSTMRRGKHGGRKAHRSEGYDEARIAQMRTNIAKLEEQLEVEKGLLQPRADQKGADAARARLKAWYERERHDTIKPAGTGVEGDPGQEERKILRLQRRVARTLRTVARERRARMQHEAIEAEESRRRKAVNDERATREQHAAAERVAERVRQAREEDAARRKAEERQARARLAADRTRVDQLRRRTRERMKKMSTLERREAPDHYTIIGNEGVEKARRLAARRAKQTHQRIMREQQAAAARQAHELSLRRREMEETVKRYRTRSAGVTGHRAAMMPRTRTRDGGILGQEHSTKDEPLRLPPIPPQGRKASQRTVRAAARVQEVSVADAVDEGQPDSPMTITTTPSPHQQATSSSSDATTSPSCDKGISEGGAAAAAAAASIVESGRRDRWKPVVAMMDDEYFIELAKRGVSGGPSTAYSCNMKR